MRNFFTDGDFRLSTVSSFDVTANEQPSPSWTSRGTESISSVSRGVYAGSIYTESDWAAIEPKLPDPALQKVCVLSITSPAARVTGHYGAAIATTVTNGCRIFAGARARISAWVFSTSRYVSFSLTEHFGDSSSTPDRVLGSLVILVEPNQWQHVSHDFVVPYLHKSDDLHANDSLIFEFAFDNVDPGAFASEPLFMVESNSEQPSAPFTAVTGFTCERVADFSFYEPLIAPTSGGGGGGGGSGTVTSVALSAPSSIASVSGSPVTVTGTLGWSLKTQAPATAFLGPVSGSNVTPTFRALVATDIPSLDAGKITSGTFTTGQIPSLSASKITSGLLDLSLEGAPTGTGLAGVSSGAWMPAAVTGVDATFISSGTLSTSRIPALDAAKITTGLLSLTLEGAPTGTGFAHVTSGVWDSAAVTGADASFITTGTFTTSQIPSLDAAKITTGTFTTSQIPSLDAAKITTGTIATARLGSGTASSATFLHGDQTYGVLLAADIPALDAAKVTTGSFSTGRIPGLDASKIVSGLVSLTLEGAPTGTGFAHVTAGVWDSAAVTLVSTDIPNLDASKITTGTVATARLGSGTANSTSFLRGDQTWQTITIPSTPTGTGLVHITSGAQDSTAYSLLAADIPNLDAAKITTGALVLARQASPTGTGIVHVTSGAWDSAAYSLLAADIPNLDASKITTGALALARITSPTGTGLYHITSGAQDSAAYTLLAADIPNLDASKITTGSLALARMTSPTGTGLYHITSGALDSAAYALLAADIPSLDASKITTGSLSLARLAAPTGTGYAHVTSGAWDSAAIVTGYAMHGTGPGTAGTLSANTTYFFGCNLQVAYTGSITEGLTDLVVPVSGTLTGFWVAATIRGTLGSSENITYTIDYDSGTNVGSTNAQYTAAAVRTNVTGLSQAVVAGHHFALKLVTPVSWVTPPTTVSLHWGCFISVP